MMARLHLTLPLLPGKTEAWRRFCQELNSGRREEYESSRRRLGIVGETLAPVETSLGTAVLFTIEAPDVGRALTRLADSERPFDRWFKEKLREMHGFWLANATGEQTRVNPATPHFLWPPANEND